MNFGMNIFRNHLKNFTIENSEFNQLLIKND